MTDDYSLDADRMDVYEPYSPSVYVLTNEASEPEGPSLPFGFTRHRDLATTPVRLPEPWMWWK